MINDEGASKIKCNSFNMVSPIYSPVHGYLCCFLFGIITHKAARNVRLPSLNQHMMRTLRNGNFIVCRWEYNGIITLMSSFSKN